jgi:hypothetical protein
LHQQQLLLTCLFILKRCYQKNFTLRCIVTNKKIAGCIPAISSLPGCFLYRKIAKSWEILAAHEISVKFLPGRSCEPEISNWPEQQLVCQDRATLIADHLCDGGGKIAARAISANSDPRGITIEH